jgi:hypothetical protein
MHTKRFITIHTRHTIPKTLTLFVMCGLVLLLSKSGWSAMNFNFSGRLQPVAPIAPVLPDPGEQECQARGSVGYKVCQDGCAADYDTYSRKFETCMEFCNCVYDQGRHPVECAIDIVLDRFLLDWSPAEERLAPIR